MADTLDIVFAALADPTRRRILALLLEDDMAVTDVASAFDISLAAISKHLGALDKAGLITREKRGRVVWCKLEPDALRDASVWMQAFGQFDGPDLDALEGLLDAFATNMGDGLLAALVAAETDVWRALQTGDAAADEAALHPSFLGVYTDGPADRAAHTGQLANGPTIAEFAIDRAQAMPLAPALALLTYRARFTRMGGDAAEEMWVSSLWRAEADGWVNLFSQDTPAR